MNEKKIELVDTDNAIQNAIRERSDEAGNADEPCR